jgi:Ethanolamine utilization protein EutJ (predicted chaperonin)
MKFLKSIISFFLLFFSINSFSQELYGGIEIGSQGIRTSIIKIKNVENETFEMVEFWTTNVGLAKNLSKTGTLDAAKIDQAVKIVSEDFETLQKELNVKISNIYIVASSGISKAKNLDVLVDQIIDCTLKKVNIVSSKAESVFLLRGSVPKENYLNSLILDFGATGIKGGYVIETKSNDVIFQPISVAFGTISLSEILEQKTNNKKNIDTYNEEVFKYIPTLDEKMQNVFNQHEISKTKNLIYLAGGAPWAYCMLNLKTVNDYNEFTFRDLQEYNAFLQNSFQKYVDMSATNLNIEKVLKTYNQKQLIAANTLLMSSLENIGNLDTKKIYFTKKSQTAWLISYVLDSAKGIKIPN